MTEIILSFDTEDFTNPGPSADAIKTEARIMHSEGVRGCFVTVGLLARMLTKHGRTDVIEAMKRHEIGLHTYGHTLHPLINEYTDIENWREAADRVKARETEAAAILREVFGDIAINAACPPGNQTSYAAQLAYAEMGIPIYSDAVADTPDGRGVHFRNMFALQYVQSMESVMFTGGEKELRDMLDRLAGRRFAIIYTHPHISVYKEHWDVPNFDKKNLYPDGNYVIPERRSDEDSARFFENMRLLIRLIKADGRFRFTTYGEIASRLARLPARRVLRAQIPAISDALGGRVAPIGDPASLSPADLFFACAAFLRGEEEYPCGMVYGPMDEPVGITDNTTVTAEQIRASAFRIDCKAPVPARIDADGTVLGPADWLFAALAALNGEEKIVLRPRPQLPDLTAYPELLGMRYKGTWRHSDEFEDRYLSDRLRYQSWTLRPAEDF